MPSDRDLALGAGTIVILGLPAYMGWAGHNALAFGAYTVVAGTGLTAADLLVTSALRRESVGALLQHASLRIGTIAIIGGCIFALTSFVF